MRTIIRFIAILLGPALFIFQQPAGAEITKEMQESTVRIITLGRDPNNPQLPACEATQLTGNDIFYEYQWSMGTGFVVSKDGCVITNNHVVAPTPLSAESHALIFVLQKLGDKYFLHRAKVEKQDPNSDVAVLRVPTLQVNPFDFAPSDPPLNEGDEVFSIGFPGMADVSVVREDREARFAKELEENILKNEEKVVEKSLPAAIDHFVKSHAGQQPNAEEKEALKKQLREIFEEKVTSMVNSLLATGAAELGDFLHDLDLKTRTNLSSSVWDVSAAMNQGLRKGYITPTVTRGNVERITMKSGFVQGGASIPIVQHNLHIMHGNSGGPLLNGGGQIAGVVGDGKLRRGEGIENAEMLSWATSSSILKTILSTDHIAFIIGPPWTNKQLSTPLIVATAIAIAIAIAALVLGVIKTRRKTGFTTILTDWKTKGGSATELIRRLLEGNGNSPRDVRRPQPAGDGKWSLTGRTSGGKTLKFALTEDMFAQNGSRLILGRSAELCNLAITDETISRQHAEIRKEGADFQVADRNSSNGTAVNGVFNRKPFEAVSLKPGDTLTLGEVKLNFAKN